MISRNRSGPTAAAMSMDPTTSANRTVTCLYSAGVSDAAVGEPHSSQNFAVGRNSAAHLVQANAAVMGLTIGLALPTGRQHGGPVAPIDAVRGSALVGEGGAPQQARAQQPGGGVDHR